MSGPFILISSWGIKNGKVEELTRFQRELAEFIQENEPQLIAFNAFLNEDRTEMTAIQVHPDAASMDFHLNTLKGFLGDSWSAVAPFVEPKSVEYYGTPPQSLIDNIANRAGDRRSKPIHIAGFTRSPSA